MDGSCFYAETCSEPPYAVQSANNCSPTSKSLSSFSKTDPSPLSSWTTTQWVFFEIQIIDAQLSPSEILTTAMIC